MIPKFKAFCKRHKCIEEVFQITYLGDNDIKVEAECLSGYVGSDFILMQSTGLHDKNGVEIFEGDVVRLQYGHTGYYVVEWHEKGMWIFRYIKDIKQYYTFEVVDDFSNFSDEGLKKIGNIHENPELLEVV